MCGRFTVRKAPGEIARIFRTVGVPPNYPPRYNIAPTQDVLTVRFNPEDGARHLNLLRWGLVPSWAKDKAVGYKTINARAEGIEAKPSFRGAFAKRRCIIPADGFYEWQKADGKKQPYAIEPTGAPMFAFAGLWEGWRDPERSGEIVRTCTIITCPANELIAPIHDRMPVILDEADWATWLGEEDVTPGELQAMLKPFPAERMSAYKIGTRVNSVRNDDEAILAHV